MSNDRENEALRTALRTAEEAIRAAARAAHGSSPFDDTAVTNLLGAEVTLRRLRRTLETGKWPGRSVDADREDLDAQFG